ncbi:MAG: SPASM domain-containing protein, partial [Verrucomicrobiota bacterium]
NLRETPLARLVDSPTQKKFGADKSSTLPRYCRECPVKFACNGDCPKHRFCRTPDGEPGLSYLCKSYRRFFTHIDPAMKTMAALLKHGRAAAEIMRLSRVKGAGGYVG